MKTKRCRVYLTDEKLRKIVLEIRRKKRGK